MVFSDADHPVCLQHRECQKNKPRDFGRPLIHVGVIARFFQSQMLGSDSKLALKSRLGSRFRATPEEVLKTRRSNYGLGCLVN